jgi:ABC-type branched-subunit amino acid transport system ATPase component
LTTLLTAEEVDAGYNGRAVLTNLNLRVERGEVVALLGPNGAGKTTTLLALAGAITPLAGVISLDGRPISAPMHRRTRDGLGFVPEGRSVFKRLTVEENLRVGRCETDYAVGLFPELKPLLKRIAGKLSGGEQQMLSLARALGRHPRLLLADELSLGLAPMIVTRLLEAVCQEARNGLGVILVEQHVHQALKYSDRVYALRRGSIVAAGTVDDVRDKLESAYLSEVATIAGETADRPSVTR